MKYRKKPVIIEAVQFDGTASCARTILEWGGPKCGMEHVYTSVQTCPNLIMIETLEGKMRAMPNDWIIRGINGEFYPCKPDIFQKTYEPVEDRK